MTILQNIKKLFVCVIFMVVIASPVFADVMPYYSGSILKNTIGFLQVPQKFNVYLYPREDSTIVDNISWTNTEVKLSKTNIEPASMFAVLISSKNQSFCMVVDEEENGWYKIVYDKSNGKSGWVKPANPDDFWGLRDFISYYGRRYGLAYMKNIDYRKRGLYSGAYDEAQKLGGFTLIKNIRPHKVSGNWVLVTVVDLDSKPKIGYIRWRLDDGTIIVFPRFDKQ